MNGGKSSVIARGPTLFRSPTLENPLYCFDRIDVDKAFTDMEIS